MKAQIALEGILAVAIILLIFSILSLTLVNKQLQVDETKAFLDVKEVCNKLEREIKNALLLGDGSETNVWLNKNVTVVNGAAKVERLLCSVHNLTNGSSSNFNIARGFVTLINRNGNIQILGES